MPQIFFFSFSFFLSPQAPTLNYILVRPSAGLLFPAVDYLRIYLLENLANEHHKLLKTFKNTKIVVLDCKHIDKIDFTAARVRVIILNSRLRIWPGFYFFEPSSFFLLQRYFFFFILNRVYRENSVVDFLFFNILLYDGKEKGKKRKRQNSIAQQSLKDVRSRTDLNTIR